MALNASWSDYLSVASIVDIVDDYQPWFCSIVASVAIGLSGVLPVLVVPCESTSSKSKRGSRSRGGVPADTLRLLLSFAVGGLLGDVFLHLLPEAWNHLASTDNYADLRHRSSYHVTIGLWVLAGVFTFIVVEMMFEKENSSGDAGANNGLASRLVNGHHVGGGKSSKSSNARNGAYVTSNGVGGHQAKHNGHNQNHQLKPDTRAVTGYLNLLANGIDNFAHGLAVAGSFLVSFKVGLLTTFAILIHEIPHEVADFAILLRSNWSRLDAVRAQMATASVGLAGAIAALSAESAQTLGERTAWILPFTAGGFLHIALVSVLPDILQEKDPKESIKQVACLLAGIGVMAAVTIVSG